MTSGQYRRLQLLLELPPVKSPGGETMLKRSVTESSAMSYLQKASYAEKVKRVVFYALVIFGWCTGYFLCALPWGTDLIYSYNMLYAAPPTFAMVDWMFLILLGHRYWNFKTLVLVFGLQLLNSGPGAGLVRRGVQLCLLQRACCGVLRRAGVVGCDGSGWACLRQGSQTAS